MRSLTDSVVIYATMAKQKTISSLQENNMYVSNSLPMPTESLLINSIVSVQKELEIATKHSCTYNKVADLAKNINKTVRCLLNNINTNFLMDKIGEETLYTSYLIANKMKPATGLNKELWAKLAKEVQKFFHDLTPLFLPPTQTKALNLIYCISPIENQDEHEGLPVLFGDDFLFQAQFNLSLNGFLFFQVPEFPDVMLCGTARTTLDAKFYERYVTEMPKEIQQVFDVKGVDEQIVSISKNEAVSSVIKDQYIHQKKLLKTEYYNMLLDTLGVPVDRPIDIAKRGEWVVTENKPIKSLHNARFSSESDKDIVVKGIRQFLELELEYGIRLIGDGSLFSEKGIPIMDKKNLFVQKGTRVFSQSLREKLLFIYGPVAQRHKNLRIILSELYPSFIDSVFETPITDKRKGEEIAIFLGNCVRNKWIPASSLLDLDQSILEIVQILTQHPDLSADLKVLSQTKNEPIFCSIAEILTLASSIADSLPVKGVPINLENLTDTLIEKQKSLKILLFKYFLQTFQEKKQPSFNAVVQMAVNLLIDQANQVINQETTTFFSTFLTHFLEELSEILESKMGADLLFYQITLLRAANSINYEVLKVGDALHHCLHTHMMAKEKARIINKLRDRVSHYALQTVK